MFCGFKNHHGDTRLITMQYQITIDKIKKQCKSKKWYWILNESRCQFWRFSSIWCKVSSSMFQHFYERHQIWPSKMHQYCFELLIRQIDPLLNEGRALSMTNFLSQFKSILKDSNYKLFDSYSQTWLKQCLVKYYSSEICFSKVLGKKTYKSVCLFISLFQFLKSSILLQIIKGN